MDKSLRKRKRDEENEEAHQKLFKSTDVTVEDLEPNTVSDCSNSGISNEDSDKDNSDRDESPVEKFRRGEDLPSDLDMGSNCGSDASTSGDDQDDGDWNMMGAALEREFLGLDD